MWSGIDRLGPFLADLGLASTAWLGLVSILMVCSRQPSRRCALARAGVVGALAMIPLVGLGVAPRIEVPSLLRAAFAPIGEGLHWPIRPAGLASIDPGHPSRTLLVVYLAGVAASLAWLLLGCWGTGWLARHSIEPSLANRELYRALPFESAWRRPRLRVAPRVARPVLLGICRATILIPPELNLPEARDQLRLSLLHELAHAQRRDPIFGLAAGLVQAFWFFLPPIWWIRTQMRLDQEFLADHRAAVDYGPFGTYAASLLDLAHPGPTPDTTVRARAPRLLGAGSALFQRVLMLVRCPFPVETRPPRWLSRWLPVAAAIGTLLASGLTFHEAGGRARPVPPNPSIFSIARLDMARPDSSPEGRTYPILGISLPGPFDLTLEVLATPDDLARTRVVGFPLGPPDPPRPDSRATERWHHVRVRRGPEGVGLWLDQRPIPLAQDRPDPRSFSVQAAPHGPGRFRNLKLIW